MGNARTGAVHGIMTTHSVWCSSCLGIHEYPLPNRPKLQSLLASVDAVYIPLGNQDPWPGFRVL